jgi:hypothetical protein
LAGAAAALADFAPAVQQGQSQPFGQMQPLEQSPPHWQPQESPQAVQHDAALQQEFFLAEQQEAAPA